MANIYLVKIGELINFAQISNHQMKKIWTPGNERGWFYISWLQWIKCFGHGLYRPSGLSMTSGQLPMPKMDAFVIL